MPLTEVERFLFRGQNLAHWLTGFSFDYKQVEVSLAPMRDDDAPLQPFKAVFANAVILSIEEDSERRDTWPLDIIGFDSYGAAKRWKFVLNCGCVEWVWESDWPTLGGDQ